MTFTVNEQIVNALKKARPLIENKKHRFICLAIAESSSTYGAFKIVEIIEERIRAGCWGSALETWLKEQKHIPQNAWETHYENPDFQEAMRIYRLRWIDHLIEEFPTQEAA